jgi:hypothetical protein
MLRTRHLKLLTRLLDLLRALALLIYTLLGILRNSE